MFDALREALTQATRADSVLNLLLEYCTRFVSHALIAAVQQQTVRAFSALGHLRGVNDLSNPQIQPRPDGYLAHVCQGQTYYQGPVHDAELEPWLIDLSGRLPVDILIIPITLGERTPLLALLDNGDAPIPPEALSQLFPAIHLAATRLAELLAAATAADTGGFSSIQAKPSQAAPTPTAPAVQLNTEAASARMTRQPLGADEAAQQWGGLWTRPRVQRPPAAAAPAPPTAYAEESGDLDIVVDIDDDQWAPKQDKRRLYMSHFGREMTPHRVQRPTLEPATATAPSIERPTTANALPPPRRQPDLATFDTKSSSGSLVDLTDAIEPLEPAAPTAPAAVEIDYDYWVERLDHPDPATAQRALNLVTRPSTRAITSLLAAFPGRLLIDRFKFDRDMPPASQHSRLLYALLQHGAMATRPIIHQTLDRGLDDCFYSLLFFIESGDPSVLPHLYKHLFSRDPQIRQAALQLLRLHRRDPIATELCVALRQNLRSTQLRLIELSLQALAALREAPAIPDILPCLDHANARISESAHTTLCAIALDDPGPSLARWSRWVQANPPPYSRHLLVARALLHSDRAIRQFAADELPDLTSPSIPYHPDDARADRQIAADLLLQRFQR